MVGKKRGNSQYNIINEGLVCSDNNYIYYSNITSDEGKLYRINSDGSEKIKLSDDINTKYINVMEDSIYYASTNCIYKLHLTSKQKKIIDKVNIDENIYELNIIGDYAFYSTDVPKSSLYKMNLLTNERYTLCDDSPMFINILEEYIIYLAEFNNDTCIYKMNFDGSKKTKIIDDDAWYINNINNDLYYASDNDSGHLYKLTEKNSVFKIYDHRVSHINNDTDYLYFSNANEYGALYKFNIESLKSEILEDEFTSNILLIDDYIYYVRFKDENNTLCRMRKDGTDKQIIE